MRPRMRCALFAREMSGPRLLLIDPQHPRELGPTADDLRKIRESFPGPFMPVIPGFDGQQFRGSHDI